jgi:hypothetical protein
MKLYLLLCLVAIVFASNLSAFRTLSGTTNWFSCTKCLTTCKYNPVGMFSMNCLLNGCRLKCEKSKYKRVFKTLVDEVYASQKNPAKCATCFENCQNSFETWQYKGECIGNCAQQSYCLGLKLGPVG